MMTALGIVGSLTLFLILGTAFVAGHLMLGRFLRPKNPTPEKLAIYECGEPTIGTSFVQFDLRFYVIALVFIIFEVEAAFFFPWAVIAGQAAELSDPVHIASAEALARTTTPKNSPVDDTDPPADEQTVALWRQLASGSQRRPVPKQDVPPPPQTPSARDDVAGVVAGPVNSHAPFSASRPNDELRDSLKSLWLIWAFSSSCCWSVSPTSGSGAISTGCVPINAVNRPRGGRWRSNLIKNRWIDKPFDTAFSPIPIGLSKLRKVIRCVTNLTGPTWQPFCPSSLATM